MSIPVIDLQRNSNIITLFDYPAGVGTARNLVDGIHTFGVGVTSTPAVDNIAEFVAKELYNYLVKSA